MTRLNHHDIERYFERGGVRAGITRDDLPTPALLLDLNAFEYNVAKMAAHCRDHGLKLRPHAKTHKCPRIAATLIEVGAVGLCAAKISEAEVFADHGVHGMLVTTPLVGRFRIQRGISLALRSPDVIFVADDADNLRDLNDAAPSTGMKLNVAVELHVGRKAGVQPGEPALALARLIESLPHLKFAGLQAYAGQASHICGYTQRRQASGMAMLPALETRALLEKSGIECPMLSGGSTGTYNIDCALQGLTELQPGSYIFMDIDYSLIGGPDGPEFGDFRNALTVLGTVVSKPAKDMALLDAGYKAFATDRPFGPRIKSADEIAYEWAGDEHGRLHFSANQVQTGDRIEFLTPHCDPTVNLYDRIYCCRGECVEDIWRISARGMCQ
jgi:D-serine deaminase-like pyridoxal phosphate-dependent protein